MQWNIEVNNFFQVGGFDGSSGLNSAEMYDPKTREWRMISSMSTRRSSVGVGVVKGLLYAVLLFFIFSLTNKFFIWKMRFLAEMNFLNETFSTYRTELNLNLFVHRWVVTTVHRGNVCPAWNVTIRKRINGNLCRRCQLEGVALG